MWNPGNISDYENAFNAISLVMSLEENVVQHFSSPSCVTATMCKLQLLNAVP